MKESKSLRWEPYALAKGQYPDEPYFAEALARCVHCTKESPAYMYFVDPKGANEPGAEWQFDQNIMLESEDEGMLVLDVLKDGRIGGVEFVARLCPEPEEVT